MIQTEEAEDKRNKIDTPPRDWLAIGIAFAAIIVACLAAYYTSQQAEIANNALTSQINQWKNDSISQYKRTPP